MDRSTTSTQARGSVASRRALDIELLALDMNTCTRCVGTLASIERAMEVMREVLEITGIEARVRQILIESEEQARRHRFESSPTIRMNGRDIVFETLESRCDACTDLCGCEEGTNCRIWRYQGQEYTEAPVGLIVEAMLREIYREPASSASEPVAYGGVPENLQRFFSKASAAPASSVSSCCSEEEQEVCCEPSAKSSCCGTAAEASCGCQ